MRKLLSNPVSNSLPRSGPSFGLPNVSGVTAGWSPGPVIGAYVLNAENWSGYWPVSPYAARRRSELSQSTWKNGSSLTTQDKLALG